MERELRRRSIRIGQTIATLICPPAYEALAEAEVRRCRESLLRYAESDGRFLSSLAPIEVGGRAPEIVRRMAAAAARFGVGPMAAVAGGIAQCVVERLAASGCGHAVFDNGGDIVMKIDRPVVVGIFTGPAKIKDIGLRCDPRPVPFSVCTSSGTVGHSLSFGRADAATIVAGDGFAADAAATALGNRIRTGGAGEMQAALEEIVAGGVEGALVVAGERLALAGRLPQVLHLPVPAALASQA